MINRRMRSSSLLDTKRSGRTSVSMLIAFVAVAALGVLLSFGWRSSDTQQGIDALASSPVASPSPVPSQFRTIFSSFTFDRSVSLADTQRSINSFVPGQGITAQYPVDVYTLSIEISVEDGSYSPVKALVFVPKATNSAERFPLLVYAAGTTGLDDRCAPSRENQARTSFGNYINQMTSQASQGFVVMMPNYEGLDNPDRLQYYFSADLEARVLLGTARELLRARPTQSLPIQKNTLFFGGYSQGGHASFAAADFSKLYTPDLKISGIIGHGPTTDLYEFLKDNPNLAPYLMYAFHAYYPDFTPQDILTENELRRLPRARELCVDQAFQYNTTNQKLMYNAQFLEALLGGTVPDKYPAIARRLEQNTTGLYYEGIPTFIVQGDRDPIVTLEFQKQFADQLCENNVPVTFAEYKNLDHFQSRMRSFKDTNDWIRKVANNQPVEKLCN